MLHINANDTAAIEHAAATAMAQLPNIDAGALAIDIVAAVKALRIVAEAHAAKAQAKKTWYQNTPVKVAGGVVVVAALAGAGYYGYKHFTKVASV